MKTTSAPIAAAVLIATYLANTRQADTRRRTALNIRGRAGNAVQAEHIVVVAI